MTAIKYKLFLYGSMSAFIATMFLVSIFIPTTPFYVYLISAAVFGLIMLIYLKREIRIAKPVLQDERTKTNAKEAAHLTFQIMYQLTYSLGIIILAFQPGSPAIKAFAQTLLGIGIFQGLLYGIIYTVKNRVN